MEDLIASLRRIRPGVSKEQLQMLFLEYSGRLSFGNSAVIQAESEFFISKGTATVSDLYLAINACGIHFFDRSSSRHLKSLRLRDIEAENCKFDKHTLKLVVQKADKSRSYLLRTDQSSNIKQALKLYAEKTEQTASLRNNTRSDSDSDSL